MTIQKYKPNKISSIVEKLGVFLTVLALIALIASPFYINGVVPVLILASAALVCAAIHSYFNNNKEYSLYILGWLKNKHETIYDIENLEKVLNIFEKTYIKNNRLLLMQNEYEIRFKYYLLAERYNTLVVNSK